jgi:hypothetical protein
MIYTDDTHRERLEEQVKKLHSHQQNDVYYLSALYNMTSTEELFQKMFLYFDIDGGFLAAEMFAKEDFSSGNLILAKLTGHLFNDNYQVTPLDLISLGEESYKTAMSAIYIRKYGLQ